MVDGRVSGTILELEIYQPQVEKAYFKYDSVCNILIWQIPGSARVLVGNSRVMIHDFAHNYPSLFFSNAA